MTEVAGITFNDQTMVIRYLWRDGVEQKFNLKMFIGDTRNEVFCVGCKRSFRMRLMLTIMRIDPKENKMEFSTGYDRGMIKGFERMKEEVLMRMQEEIIEKEVWHSGGYCSCPKI